MAVSRITTSVTSGASGFRVPRVHENVAGSKTRNACTIASGPWYTPGIKIGTIPAGGMSVIPGTVPIRARSGP